MPSVASDSETRLVVESCGGGEEEANCVGRAGYGTTTER